MPVGDPIVHQTSVVFDSRGVAVRGVLVTPGRDATRLPTVIMAHGTSATISMTAIDYARAFAEAGMAVILYDHLNFGISDGAPRFEINPWVQCAEYVDAITYAISRPEVDPERIGLWGDSYTGGQVVLVSACDGRAKVIVAQCPVFGPSVPPTAPSAGHVDDTRRILAGRDFAGTPETTTGPLPVVSSDQLGTPSLLAPIQAYRWFIEYGGRPGSGWSNRVTRVLPPTAVPYSPYLCAPFVQAHVLLMASPTDEMVGANYAVARQAFELMPAAKSWYDIADGHFGLLYCPGPRFDEAVGIQTQYLVDTLCA